MKLRIRSASGSIGNFDNVAMISLTASVADMMWLGRLECVGG